MHFCDEGGVLVSADGYLPSDPAEGWTDGLSELVGCTALVCQRCGERVRSGLGRLKSADVPRCFADPEPTTPAPPLRTYLCLCTSMGVGAGRLASAPTPDGFVPPWTCTGHREPAMPWSGHGLEVTAELVGLDFARTVLADGAPAAARPRDRQFPEALLVRIVAMFGGGATSQDIEEAVAALLTDATPVVRGRAARFAFRRPRSAAAGRIRSLLADRLDLYRDVADPDVRGSTLEAAMALALGRRSEQTRRDGVPLDPASRRYLTSHVAVSSVAVQVLPSLARIEPAWLARNGPFVAATSPGAGRAVLEALVYNKAAEALVAARRLVGSGDLTRDQAREVFEYSSHPDRLAALAALGAPP